MITITSRFERVSLRISPPVSDDDRQTLFDREAAVNA